MANIINELTARIEEYRATNKQPCKNYGSEAAAEKATADMAMRAALHFAKDRNATAENTRPARYVVFYVEAWGRWVGCIDLSELLSRSTSTGGYLGFCKGFFTY